MARPIPEPRTPKSERTRAALLEAAERLFAERGFEATRLEDVASAVGIRRASIVYHFRDKRELYDAVLGDVFGGLLARTRAALRADAPLAPRIENAVSEWVDYVGGRPSLARLLLREVAGASPGLGPVLRPYTLPFIELVEEVQAEGRAGASSGSGPGLAGVDPAHLASTIAGATLFFVAALPVLMPEARSAAPSPQDLETHRLQVLRITRRLLGLPPPSRRSRSRPGPGRSGGGG